MLLNSGDRSQERRKPARLGLEEEEKG